MGGGGGASNRTVGGQEGGGRGAHLHNADGMLQPLQYVLVVLHLSTREHGVVGVGVVAVVAEAVNCGGAAFQGARFVDLDILLDPEPRVRS